MKMNQQVEHYSFLKRFQTVLSVFIVVNQIRFIWLKNS